MSVAFSVEYKDFMVDCKKVDENTTLTNTIGQYSNFQFAVQAGFNQSKIQSNI